MPGRQPAKMGRACVVQRVGGSQRRGRRYSSIFDHHLLIKGENSLGIDKVAPGVRV